MRGWALIAAGWWRDRRARAPLAAVLGATEQHGGAAWLGWVLTPGPGEWRRVLGRVLVDVQAAGGRIVINPEREWRGSTPAQARELVAALRAGGAREVWCAAYGAPSRAWPWAAFAEVCDGIIAQTLDRLGEHDGSAATEGDYVEEAQRAYLALGARRVLVSLGGWRQDQHRAKTAEELAPELAVRAPLLTVVWAPSWTSSVCRSLAAWARGVVSQSSSGPPVALLLLGLAATVAVLRS